MIDLSSLNEKQKQAATAPLGAVLVLAGPGSGKTKTLTHRIAYIIDKRMVHPSNILSLTFTNKAAKEMRERVNKLLIRLPGASEHLVMGTFHSVCVRLLRKEITALGYANDFVIFDSDDQSKVIKDILEELRIDTKRLPASLFSALISRAKNLLQLPSELNIGIDSPLAEQLQEVYARYQDSLYKQNGVDFDDLLMLTVKLFENYPKVLEKYQKLFKYVLVDEYQDTNPAQYAFLKLLTEHHNVFVVGDDAQSIYGFRGSDIRNILSFEQDFPESLIIKLEQNYRSSKNILQAAQKVIEMNPEQRKKTLWTQNSEGEKIVLHEAENERAEAEFVARKIIELSSGKVLKEAEPIEEPEDGNYSILDRFLKARKMYGTASLKSFRPSRLVQMPKDHASLKEYCILYRTHAQSRALEEVLIESGIPYTIVGGLKFYERKEIKDTLAYLRLAINFRDLVSLKRVINEPARGIGDKSYQVVRDFILDTSANFPNITIQDFRLKLPDITLSPKQHQSVLEFFTFLEEVVTTVENTELPAFIRKVAKRSGYEQSVRDGSEQGESRWENVEELMTVAAKFKNQPWREAATSLLEEVALLSEIDQKDENKDAVTLMTLHSAKGLEFDNVFFVGLEEGILPHSRSLIETDQLSEEIRLAYVGLTRARKKLFLIYAASRRIYGDTRVSQPSRILRVLPQEVLDMQGVSESFFVKEEDGELTVEEMEF
ncbi:MAG: UvrD-helicase domain-containing protein [Candidatus Doudnabacteria bacterium]|nr:UvrD-helicase domain-containing protein [Candidatus Doudnabacteria bacterium]